MVKVIIDTDPGVDDAMAILSAANWSEVEVIGLTTLFGNVPVSMATENALILRDLIARVQPEAASIPVCCGSSKTLSGDEKPRIADFVHGQDGFGNRRPALSAAEASSQSAADFLVETLNKAPGEITVLALAACTNIALALQQDPDLHTKWKELVILGGAFTVPGNVNPAAEANILGDPEAADYVLSRSTNVWMIGLDVTHDCTLSGEALRSLNGKGHFGSFLQDISQFYLAYHVEYYNRDRVHLHDPTALLGVARKDLFEWRQGPVVVGLEGTLRGKTVANLVEKKWAGDHEWLHRPAVKVAVAAKSEQVSQLCFDLMSA